MINIPQTEICAGIANLDPPTYLQTGLSAPICFGEQNSSNFWRFLRKFTLAKGNEIMVYLLLSMN